MKKFGHMILPVVMLLAGCKSYKLQPDLVDIRQFTPPAERGEAWAQYRLGQAYATHWIFPDANIWYHKAALQGVPEAMYALGLNHLNGVGVPKNPVEAYAWFDIAASQNNFTAINARESLATRMTRAEVEQGDRRAAVLIKEIMPDNLRYAFIENSELRHNNQSQNFAQNQGTSAADIKANRTGSPAIRQQPYAQPAAPAPVSVSKPSTKAAPAKTDDATGKKHEPVFLPIDQLVPVKK